MYLPWKQLKLPENPGNTQPVQSRHGERACCLQTPVGNTGITPAAGAELSVPSALGAEGPQQRLLFLKIMLPIPHPLIYFLKLMAF